MATGTVKWFNETKGYGFIQTDSGGMDEPELKIIDVPAMREMLA